MTHAHLPRRAVIGALTSAVLGAGLAVTPAGGTSPSGAIPASAAAATSQADHALRSPRTYRIAGGATRQTVVAGEEIRIRGGVATKPRQGAAKPRPVRLTERKGGRWNVIAMTRSSRAGAWSFMIRAGTAARTRVFRAEAPRFNRLPAARADSLRVRVVPRATTPPPPSTPPPATPSAEPTTPVVPPRTGEIVTPEYLPDYVPLGRADDWSYLMPGGSRWNPCEPIEWAYNPTREGYDALADVRRAFARVSGSSGLTFAYVGPTGSRYTGTDAGLDRGVDMVVGWADDVEFPRLAGSVIGIGGGFARWIGGGYQMTSGYLTLDNDAVLNPGFGAYGWGLVLEHEILHALGLGHAAEDVQLMYPALTRNTSMFGAGDIGGMQRIGLPAGCL